MRLFIEQHGASRFQDVANPNAVCVNRVGFKKTGEDGTTEYIVLPEAFKSEVAKGYGSTKAAQVLAAAGWLKTTTTGRLQIQLRLPDLENVRAYVLTMPKENAENG